MLRLIELRAENFKRLTAARVAPAAGVTPIVGKNGAGKTSVLDAVAAALGGAGQAPDVPVRRGAAGAEVVADLGDILVRRRWTAKGTTTLDVTTKDGAKYPSPQAVLDKLVGELSFDPLAFTRQKPAEQAATLARAAGLDLAAHLAEVKVAFDARALANKRHKELNARLAGIPNEPAPAEEVKIADVLKRLDEAEKHNRECDDFSRLHRRRETDARTARLRVAELERELDEARKVAVRADELSAAAGEKARAAAMIDTDPLREEAAQAEETNRRVRAARERAALAEQEAAALAESERLTGVIRAAKESLDAAVSAADVKVPGLALDPALGVTLGGVPFAQCSGAEKLRASVAVGLALNPTLRLMLVRDGSLLDDDGMRLLAELAEAADAQVLVERVDTGREVGVRIVDGETV